jgi:hypothetical protein
MDGVGIRVREFNHMYNKKRHALAVIATITICYLPAHAYAANHTLEIHLSIYHTKQPPYVILKASKTEKVEAQVKLESL